MKTGDRWLYALAVAVVCAQVLFIFLVRSGVNGLGTAKLDDLITLQAGKPYVCRVLVPQIIRIISYCLGPIRASIETNSWRIPVVGTLLTRFHTEPGWATESLVAFAVMDGFLVGFTLAFRSLLLVMWGGSSRAEVISLAAPTFLLPFFRHGFVYDFATLCLFTCCLVLMAKAEWRLYLLVFILACLNKETSLLLAVVFAYQFFGMLPRKKFMWLLVLQFLIAVSIRVGLETYLSADSSSFRYYLADHFVDWKVEIPGLTIFSLLVVILLSRDVPTFLRSELVILPLIYVAYFFSSTPGEYRAMYEAFPLGVATLVSLFLGKMDGRKRCRSLASRCRFTGPTSTEDGHLTRSYQCGAGQQPPGQPGASGDEKLI